MKFFLPLAVVVLCVAMLIFPKETFDAASMGLTVWWKIVFPSLLPFFIISELFSGLGIIHLIGILLEPVMRPLFRLPGCAGFVVAIGYTSGFPIGAALTAELRRQKLVTRLEGERLMSFTNNASPLFIFVATAVGLFHNPSLGIILAVANYSANLALGLLLRFYGQKDPEKIKEHSCSGNLLLKSIQALTNAQKKDGRPFGKLLGDAVSKSIHSLAIIGGFIILFAVIVQLLTLLGITKMIEQLLALILLPLGFHPSLLTALATGLFEITLGIKLAGESAAPFSQQVTAAAMIIAWSGLSIHAQVASMVSKTDLRLLPFVLTRIAHAALSGTLVFLLLQSQSVPTTLAIWPSVSITWYYVLIPFAIGMVSLVLLPVTTVLFYLIFKTTWLFLRIKH